MKSSDRWVFGAAVGFALVVLSSGFQPWIDALSGAFIPADIAQDSAAARLFVQRLDPYGPVIRDAHARLLDVPREGTFPHFPHPPFSLIVSLPLAFGSFEVSAALWFAFTLALLMLLATLLQAALRRVEAGSPGCGVEAWHLSLLLLTWPPVLYNLEKGQWSMLLTVLLAFAWLAIADGRLRQAAAWSGAAAAVKVFPVVLGAFFLVRSLRATVWFAGTGLLLTAIPLAWIGPQALLGFIAESRLNMPYWESFPSVTFSIHGAIARLLVGGQWAEPLVRAPVAAVFIEALIVLPLLGTALWMTWRARAGRADQALVFAAWLALLPTLNPQSLGHNGLILSIPIAVVGRVVALRGGKWQQWLWVAALVLVSIPRQTVWWLTPPPIHPLAGMGVVALPTWGALILFGLTMTVSTKPAGICRTATRLTAVA